MYETKNITEKSENSIIRRLLLTNFWTSNDNGFYILKEFDYKKSDTSSEDYLTPSKIRISDGESELFIGRMKEKKDCSVFTEDGTTFIFCSDIEDEFVKESIRSLVKNAYWGKPQTSNWDSSEDACEVVTDFLLRTLTHSENEQDAIDAMRAKFGEKFDIESKTAIGSMKESKVQEVAGENPYLVLADWKFAEYVDAIPDKDFYLYWTFDEEFPDLGVPISQLVFLRPKQDPNS